MCILLACLILAVAGPSRAQDEKDDRENEDRAPREVVAPASLDAGVYLDRVIDGETYVVGPGDRFGVSIPGASQAGFEALVNPEGSLLIPSIGAVAVAGETLTSAKSKIIAFLRDYYPSAEITVTLLEIRRFRVAVGGAVEIAGLRTVTANTRASEAIAMAQLIDAASRRSIRLLRGQDTIRVDLTAFERAGRTESNPYLIEGDIIVVPTRNTDWSFVQISGAVLEPVRLEYVEGETVGDLLQLSYGLAPNADTTMLELWRFQGSDTVSSRVPWPAGSTLSSWRRTPLRPDDHLLVRGVDDYHRRSSVTIYGEVKYPGVYIFPGRRVSLLALIDSAGGFTPDADLEHMQIGRGSPPTWEADIRQRVEQIPPELRTRAEDDWLLADAISIPGRISTDFVKLFGNRDRDYDVFLSDGDLISVPRHADYVNVIGRVVRPGLVPHEVDRGFDFYLQRAGGFAWQADRGRSFVIKGGTGATLKKGSVTSIDPGDLIVVPTKRGVDYWDTFKDVLMVAANLSTIYLVIDQAIK